MGAKTLTVVKAFPKTQLHVDYSHSAECSEINGIIVSCLSTSIFCFRFKTFLFQ